MHIQEESKPCEVAYVQKFCVKSMLACLNYSNEVSGLQCKKPGGE